ncbi:MAG: alpha/beta hydrolase [Nibricoccus sp.]
MKTLRVLAPIVAMCAFLPVYAGTVEGNDIVDASETLAVNLPENVRVIRDVSYGENALQRFDVYVSKEATGPAPVIFMVHGGGWRRGDKAMDRVVENKVARWVPKGFIFISANYRLLPDADPMTQAQDVAKALAAAQALAPRWGGVASKFILMGHSAGGHLVDLLGADPRLAYAQGAQPWLGTISLDAGAINVVDVMENPHAPLFDNAFGTDPDYWKQVSPHHALRFGATPFLLICSQARQRESLNVLKFMLKARSLGVSAEFLPEDLTHGEINYTLGLENDYTLDVEDFMGGLDPLVKWRLKQ